MGPMVLCLVSGYGAALQARDRMLVAGFLNAFWRLDPHAA